jgi:uncharacterized repeat protein (TIGR03803 family)
MSPNKSLKSYSNALLVTVALILALVPGAWAGDKYKLLHAFNGNRGSSPQASLISDAAGNLYGTTAYGGVHFYGTVFKLTPQGDGKWTEKVLHSFNGLDGCVPVSGLVLDALGNLYGTTQSGGESTYCAGDPPPGNGTVFELTPGADRRWTEKVLHRFKNDGKDGHNPAASLTFDAPGNLYGTTEGGGVNKFGAVFELVHGKNGAWTEKVLHSFGGNTGANPRAALIFDTAGNLYGTTLFGGNSCPLSTASGTAFELTPGAKAKWIAKTIYTFKCTDGEMPLAPLIPDGAGNLYGTAYAGGIINEYCDTGSCGVVFELTPGARGDWSEKVLHRFKYNGKDGTNPGASLVFDTAGNLYGTTFWGGARHGGIVFELTQDKNGDWNEKVLHTFGLYGSQPLSGLTFDAAGNLYGTASEGGNLRGNCPPWGCGVVFEIVP